MVSSTGMVARMSPTNIDIAPSNSPLYTTSGTPRRLNVPPDRQDVLRQHKASDKIISHPRCYTTAGFGR